MVLAGFSQGGAMSLFTGLTLSKPLAGLACLSGYLPLADEVEREATEAAKSTPVRMFHGDADEVVLLEWGMQTKERLTGMGCTDVNMTTYSGMGHTATMKEMGHVLSFITKALQ